MCQTRKYKNANTAYGSRVLNKHMKFWLMNFDGILNIARGWVCFFTFPYNYPRSTVWGVIDLGFDFRSFHGITPLP